MMIGWPSWLCSCSVMVRATMSVPLPAENGTMIQIGFDGHVCATALPGRVESTSANAGNPKRRMHASL